MLQKAHKGSPARAQEAAKCLSLAKLTLLGRRGAPQILRKALKEIPARAQEAAESVSLAS